MTRLSPHFTLSEMTASDTAKARKVDNKPLAAHLDNLRVTAHRMEAVRAILGRPIIINSAYRNPVVNRMVGGVPTSAHALGWAVDFNGNISDALKLKNSLDSYDQLILEHNGTVIHISFDPRNRKQNLTQPGGPGSPFQQGLRA